jgi:anti-sigma B factor antagonist
LRPVRRVRRPAWQPFSLCERQYGVSPLTADGGGPLKIDVVCPGAVIAISGRLGATTVADVRNALAEAVEQGVGDLVIDLHGVELVDATGLGVLVGAHRRADRAGRRVVIRRIPDRIDRLLVATRLHRVLCIDRSEIRLDEAISA